MSQSEDKYVRRDLPESDVNKDYGVSLPYTHHTSFRGPRNLYTRKPLAPYRSRCIGLMTNILALQVGLILPKMYHIKAPIGATIHPEHW